MSRFDEPTQIDRFLNALGGTCRVATMTNRTPAAVSTWRAKKRIPAEHYMVLRSAGSEIGWTAEPEWFGFSQPDAAERPQSQS